MQDMRYGHVRVFGQTGPTILGDDIFQTALLTNLFSTIRENNDIAKCFIEFTPTMPEYVWRPGTTRIRWGSLSAPHDPLAAISEWV